MNKQEVNLKSGGRACYFVAKVSDFGNAHRVSPIYFNRGCVPRPSLQLSYYTTLPGLNGRLTR
jgi:hypothetical protein